MIAALITCIWVFLFAGLSMLVVFKESRRIDRSRTVTVRAFGDSLWFERNQPPLRDEAAVRAAIFEWFAVVRGNKKRRLVSANASGEGYIDVGPLTPGEAKHFQEWFGDRWAISCKTRGDA